MNFSGSLRCSGGSRRSTAAPQQLNRRKIHQNFQYCLFFFFLASESQDMEQKAGETLGENTSENKSASSKREQKLGQKSPKREQKCLCCFIHL